MKRNFGLLVLVGLMFIPFMTAAEKSAAIKSEIRVPNFTLKDASGKSVSLHDFKDKKAVAVVFIGTECPVNNYYMRRLLELNQEFASQGVQFLAVNSNGHDSAERIKEHAVDHKLPFPVLIDSQNTVADLFKAERTPEAFVLDDKSVVRYSGRIDDQYGVGFQRPKATRREVADALNDLLAGKAVRVAKAEVSGCFIGRATKTAKSDEITYTKHVAPLFQAHCQECHRPGQIGPFSLMTYEKARGWADSIREIVSDGRMPPWHADPRYGKFSNTRSMSDKDKQTLLTWIDNGCPKGDDKDLPQPKSFMGADGWSMGKPDVVFTMPNEFKVPAQAPRGGLAYQYFFVTTNYDQDMWIQAAEAKAGNKSIVHHIIVFCQKPGQDRREGGDDRLGNGFLCATAPGDLPLVLAPGIAKKLPKGAVLAFQMHYTPNGVAQTDRSSVGLIFAKEPPKQIARTRSIAQNRFAIPPGADNHRVVSNSTFRKDSMLISLFPHMHLRGKAFEYKAVFPDGREEILLSVPRYDFNWQSYYQLEKPMKLPAGTRLVCTAHFDNSTNNLSNPDPTKTVYWGEQTWEEMMIGFLDYYYVEEKPGEDEELPKAEARPIQRAEVLRTLERVFLRPSNRKPDAQSTPEK